MIFIYLFLFYHFKFSTYSSYAKSLLSIYLGFSWYRQQTKQLVYLGFPVYGGKKEEDIYKSKLLVLVV